MALRDLLVFTRKLFVDPEEFLAFVHQRDQTTEVRVFGFEQSVNFTQGGILGTYGEWIAFTSLETVTARFTLCLPMEAVKRG